MTNDISQLSQTAARARMQAKLRVMFARSLIEPHIKKASNDDEALGLLPNHIAVLGSYAKAQLTKKSRKIAHSWGFALYALAQAATSEKAQITIGSYDEEEARNKLNFLDWQYSVLPAGERRELGMNDGSEQRKFKNGSIIKFVSRKAPTGAGGDYLGDEFSVEPPGKVSAEDILIGALGATTHTGSVRLGGTERGEETLFYKIASGEWAATAADNPIFARLPQVEWEIFEFPWWLSPALCVDIAQAGIEAPRLDTGDRVEKFGNAKLQQQFVLYLTTPGLGLALFQREFECKVVADDEGYFSLEELQACYAAQGGDYWFAHAELSGREYSPHDAEMRRAKDIILALERQINSGLLRGEFGMALDVGRHHDKDELIIGHNLPEDRAAVALRVNIGMSEMPFEGKQELWSFAMAHLPIARAAIDGTRGSVGVQLAEWGKRKWPGIVSIFEFKAGVKSVISSGVKMRAQTGKLLLPWMPSPSLPAQPNQYRELQTQMLMVRKIVTPAKNVVLDVPRTDTHHGDKYWALAMLCDLFGEVAAYVPGNVIIVPRNGGPRRGVSGNMIHATPRRRIIA